MALSKLKDADNALRAFTYSLKLDPTDPMALLNLAILQTNTGVTQAKTDVTLKEFHQYYAVRAVSTGQNETDTSMLDIAAQLEVSPATSVPKNEELARSSTTTSMFSPKRSVNKNATDSSRQTPHEFPPVKTKIYENNQHEQEEIE